MKAIAAAAVVIGGGLIGAGEGNYFFKRTATGRQAMVNQAKRELGLAMLANHEYKRVLIKAIAEGKKNRVIMEDKGEFKATPDSKEVLNSLPFEKKQRLSELREKLVRIGREDKIIAEAQGKYDKASSEYSRFRKAGPGRFQAVGSLLGPIELLADLGVVALLARKLSERRRQKG